jgi:cation diffusion facilitator family transporter
MSGAGGERGDVREVRRVTWWGLAVNVGLAALKFVVGIVGSSQAVVADAVHSLSDLVTDVAILLGVRYWSQPADEDHPYGHRRVETLVTLGIGLVLAAVALGIGHNALFTIREEHVEQPGWIAAWGPALSIVLKELLYRWTAAVGRRIGSPAVVANAWHHRSDAFSSWPALAAVVASQLNPEWGFIDHVGALIVSLFILKVAWDTVKAPLTELSGRGVSDADRRRVAETAGRIAGVGEVHAIRTRMLGTAIYLDLHVLVSGDISVRRGHDIAEEVKAALLRDFPAIADVVVHIEPVDDSAAREDG